MFDIKVPTVGESITEVTLVKWLKKEGDYVDRDEVLCELESEKATFELNAEVAGSLHIAAAEGATLKIGDIACSIDEAAAKPAAAPAEAAPAAQKEEPAKNDAKPGAVLSGATALLTTLSGIKATPVAQAIIADKKVPATDIKGTGAMGKILKTDVLEALSHPGRRVATPLSAGMKGMRK